MALRNATRLQRAATTKSSLIAALPAARVCVRPVASCQALPFTAAQRPNGLARCAVRKAMAGRSLSVKVSAVNGPGLNIDLRGKKAFIAGVADDQGFGWAIAKALAEAGAEIALGVWVPALNIFESNLRRGKFDENRKLSDGSLMTFSHIYPMDAVYDTMADVPEEVATNKRYAGNKEWTVSEVAESAKKDMGSIDILVRWGARCLMAFLEEGRELRYSYENAPVQKELAAIEVGNVAAFLVSPLASAVTGHVMFVDNGLNVMGLALDSKTLEHKE
ncbi:Enoyl-[acyl-carrier-protein] reductase [NADH], chloroplastic [Tetrabaena socialis]|uniref:Enoyl-[acyl-carrier-protein] reductase [NADH], chloroplastic n=1 Tax=Tetrabaena socialis TaxID=47790 RepID=A0A2J8A366_9CHLO|nr:Enoyl-[acyl-carrier-protein] reductase [NADH], chloroplastic [Tetrabaena socialis]|eukprot:PNH06967.1 Enoyl-[acyl-carrier-protein] reductase [NADH], chloroplastic [Tetrabaena socialis]